MAIIFALATPAILAVKAYFFRYFTDRGFIPKYLAIDYLTVACLIYAMIGLFYYQTHEYQSQYIIMGFKGGFFDLLGVIFFGIALANGKAGPV